MNKARFHRYIGIDYSGAGTPDSSQKGLRIYMANGHEAPQEVQPPPSPRKYWTRRGIALWLEERLAEDTTTLVGIDHGFSFPERYFEEHDLARDWVSFLEDFEHHWPADSRAVSVDFLRDGTLGHGRARWGNARWRRIVEKRAKAKSVFHFDVPGSVAKSTHAGIPWLRYLHTRLASKLHFWPFDGWDMPADRSAVVEVYPALWSVSYARKDRTQDQQDAFAAASWLQETDAAGKLAKFLKPHLTKEEKATANYEGWILGVM